jgi:hypothetical protein
MQKLICLAEHQRSQRQIYFDRRELNKLLSLYSRRVARGDWRDYAIDHGPGMAVFSVFRHSHERPIFSIAKRIRAPGRPADYVVLNGPQRLKSGTSIDEVLDVLDPKLRVVS